MNYVELSTKEEPFANLSEADAKKLFVYFNMIATPRLSDSEIYRRYGYILPNGSMGLDIGERLTIATQVMQELQE